MCGVVVCCSGVALRLKEMERCRAEKSEAVKELTNFKARTALDPQRSDLSGHPQFQRVRTIAAAAAACARLLPPFADLFLAKAPRRVWFIGLRVDWSSLFKSCASGCVCYRVFPRVEVSLLQSIWTAA